MLQPFAEKILASQAAANLQGYDNKFSSFTQLSELLTRIDGRGSDPAIATQVNRVVQDIHQMKPPVVTDTGPSEYEKQKAAEDPWA